MFVCFKNKIKIFQVAEHYLLYKYNPKFLQNLIFTNTAGELFISAARKVTIVSAPIPLKTKPELSIHDLFGRPESRHKGCSKKEERQEMGNSRGDVLPCWLLLYRESQTQRILSRGRRIRRFYTPCFFLLPFG